MVQWYIARFFLGDETILNSYKLYTEAINEVSSSDQNGLYSKSSGGGEDHIASSFPCMQPHKITDYEKNVYAYLQLLYKCPTADKT